MCDDCTYDKVKLMHELHRLAWFIEKNAKQDAKSAKHKECGTLYGKLQKDLEKHCMELKKALIKV